MGQGTQGLTLPPHVRWLSVVFGLFALIGSALMQYQPPMSPRPSWELTETGMSSGPEQRPDLGGYTTAALIAGFALVLYGLNGRVITHAGRDGVKSEAPPDALDLVKKLDRGKSEESAEESCDAKAGTQRLVALEAKPAESKTTTSGDLTVQISVESYRPSDDPWQLIHGASADYGLYRFDGVPETVRNASIDFWRAQDVSVQPESDFEWALRERGQGNKPWYIKYRRRGTVRVSLGGQGKKEPTIRLVSES